MSEMQKRSERIKRLVIDAMLVGIFVVLSLYASVDVGVMKFTFNGIAIILAALLFGLKDACAVAICKGLALRKVSAKQMLTVGLWFGGFQGLMPLLGYLLASLFADFIRSVDHWVAFALLGFIGVNMIREALSKEEEEADPSLSFKTMLVMAIATSIDAMAVGISFAFLDVQIVPAVTLIGVITFALSALGVKLGAAFGCRFKSKAELAGGVILISLGLKILIEHLFFGG